MIGVQVGGALKNVIALGIGIAQGANLSENSKAFLFTRGFREMLLLTQYLGGNQETLMGLSGIGDLVMSSFGKLGRNRACGELIGRGMTLHDITEKYQVTPESINTVRSVYEMAIKYKLTMPVCSGIYRTVYERYSIDELLNELMRSPLEQEC
jgi:glycerol-3-phosphate dehydrogenase (NAD(P)+)